MPKSALKGQLNYFFIVSEYVLWVYKERDFFSMFDLGLFFVNWLMLLLLSMPLLLTRFKLGEIRLFLTLISVNKPFSLLSSLTYTIPASIASVGLWMFISFPSKIIFEIFSWPFKINNEIISDEKFLIQKKLFGNDSFIKLSIGKKKHIKINLT